ncbi:hypothetical protein BASA50_004766 [Batrachochytrium salamandrivorans]|uniref:C2H2-type domain-containing protein n=1 Tax=Batrachochytrium salamandrivorans TaxID=1357716 RepID=A0ABQ8FFZ6_9FUNG|nr:hypothetical protein BASA50_004766 [Batrachochytrium salamandrivorans]KAH9273447.1 hypothetical protein BASA83_004113 [Batrachochytrium salamandrivorans]KAJ1345440.1 hypothetical protein BSLG_000953 [Batrachochytrium salamandrivorans]
MDIWKLLNSSDDSEDGCHHPYHDTYSSKCQPYAYRPTISGMQPIQQQQSTPPSIVSLCPLGQRTRKPSAVSVPSIQQATKQCNTPISTTGIYKKVQAGSLSPQPPQPTKQTSAMKEQSRPTHATTYTEAPKPLHSFSCARRPLVEATAPLSPSALGRKQLSPHARLERSIGIDYDRPGPHAPQNSHLHRGINSTLLCLLNDAACVVENGGSFSQVAAMDECPTCTPQSPKSPTPPVSYSVVGHHKDNRLDQSANTTTTTTTTTTSDGDDGNNCDLCDEDDGHIHSPVALECMLPCSLSNDKEDSIQCNPQLALSTSASSTTTTSTSLSRPAHYQQESSIKCNTSTRHPKRLAQPHHHARCFPCPIPNCGMSFFRRQNLTSHMSVHSEARAHPCLQCPAMFRRSQELKRHVLTVHAHEGCRPCFRCVTCGFAFVRADALKRHVLANNGKMGAEFVAPTGCASAT